MSIKSLAKDTAVYGVSSIVGRFLNWCLVPLYVYLFPTEEYGIVSYLYSYTAVVLVILNYGMETGFFRFANKEEDPEKVYTTSLISVGTTSLAFLILLTVFLHPISDAMKLSRQSLFVWLIGATVAVDAFCNLPFAYLRYQNRSWRFAGIKLINIGLNISLNLFFLLLCPEIEKYNPAFISWFYQPLGGQAFGIGWIFVANIISSYIILILLMPQLMGRVWRFSWELLKRMLAYSWPLLILAVAGIMSQNMGQILIPNLIPGVEEGRSMVGIYGANLKIAIIMVMFTQAFRYAYEPFIFAQAKKSGESSGQMYADAMKYFVIFGWLIFLGVMFYLPFVKYLISQSYWSGLQVVPVMMAAEMWYGIFFNLSLWYKLTDRTRWGMYLSLTCFLIMLGLNIWLVPYIGAPDGYMGSAWAAFAAYFIVMVISYFLGRKYFPLPYQIKRICAYTVLAGVFYVGGMMMDGIFPDWVMFVLRTLLIIIYSGIIAYFENVPFISSFLRRFMVKARVKLIIFSLLLLAVCVPTRADVFQDYIVAYSSMAMRQQAEYGIPASITLAQGILESKAGQSLLATQGNNHFGIKCHSDWDGDSMLKDDDKPNECFRVYSSAEESFIDHSLFLQRSRYESLYRLEPTDYRGWARGLKKCGYATSPTYAEKLISIIERYSLYVYDAPAGETIDENVIFIHNNLSANHPVRKSRGLHYVVAFPGDTYSDIAKEFGLSVADLMAFNDAGKSKSIREWEEVYLQDKKDEAPEDVDYVVIGEGESMRTVAQSYGVKLSTIRQLNKRAKDRPGTRLKLH